MVRLARYARSRSSACRRRRGFTARRRGYDTCANGKGRLCSTATHLSRIATSYTYDPEGNRDSETLSYSLSGLTGSRTSSFAIGPGGRVREQSYPDNATSQTTYKTKAQYLYDDRGQPTTLRWLPANGAAARNVAVQTRNVGGQVLTRVASLSGVAATPASPPWRNFTSTWAYDKLSRVLSQAVTDSSSVAYASQALTYRGLDDPWTMQHKLGGATYNFTFDYSARHELTSVAESGNRYTAAYTFHPSGKLNTATVCAGPLPTCVPQTGGAVLARNATYVYGSMVDPEAPTALTTPSGTFREYAYDTVGNMSSVRPGATGTPITDGFSYDGDDQLRRAIKYSNGFQTGREEYYYDLDGNRRAVVTLSGLGVPTSARVFIGDAEIELTNTGAINKVYSYLSMGTPVAKVVSPTGGWLQSSSSTVASSVELQYQGLANNTLLSVQPTGVVQSGFVYGPYGDVIQTSGTAGGLTGQHRRFNDKFRDDQTGLSYYGVRYYDPTLLAWTQADPLYRFVPDAAWGDPRKAGLYQFVLSNPLSYIDPDGRQVLIYGSERQAEPLRQAYMKVLGVGVTVVPSGIPDHLSVVVNAPKEWKFTKTQQMLVDAARDNSKIVVLHNANMGDASMFDPREVKRAGDAAKKFNPVENGGGVTAVTATGGGNVTVGGNAAEIVADVAVDFSSLPQVAAANGGKTEQTPDTVLVHEMAHAYGGCTGGHAHSCAKTSENRYRDDTGKTYRDTQKD
ncbi:MAG: RHS repeat-associated core domain-containing protein [Myxococcales bacterium]|nr:RHS repeat-associated core domain-containing protein [Myxococcales bacterium]